MSPRRAQKNARPAAASTLIAAPAQPAWPYVIALLAIGLAAYSNAFGGPFIFDDIIAIVTNGSIRELWSTMVLNPARELPVSGRPLVNVSFAANYAINGLQVWGYHAVNIALHLACAMLLFGIVHRTLRTTRMASRFAGRATPLAFAAAAIWMVHPLNTEAVNYVTQRTELLMALCYLTTMYGSVRAGVTGRAGWLVVAGVASMLGMASKEVMATAPIAVLLFDRIFLFDSLREAWSRRWRFYGGLVASWLVLALLMASGPRIHSAGFGSGVSVWTYLLNQAEVITHYLRLAVWPQGLAINYGAPRALSVGDVAAPLMAIVALLAVMAVVLARWPAIGFLGVWFFLTLAPSSSLVPIATEVGAERRVYLPLAALSVLFVVGAVLARDPFAQRTRAAAPWPAIGWAALAVVVGALSLGSWQRNRDYSSALTLAETNLAARPSAVAHLLVGSELMAAGRGREAVEHLQAAAPEDARASYLLGRQSLSDGRIDAAIDALTQFVTRAPLRVEGIDARTLLGSAFASQQRWDAASEQFRLVLIMDRHNLEAQRGLGDALVNAGQYEAAAEHLAAYLAERPADVGALTSLGISQAARGQADEAIATFTRAVNADPRNGRSHRNLANALLDRGRATEAAAEAQMAMQLLPGDAVAREIFNDAQRAK